MGEAILDFLELDEETKAKITLAARGRIMTEFSLAAEQIRLQEVLNQLETV